MELVLLSWNFDLSINIMIYQHIYLLSCSLFNTTHKSLVTPPLRMTLEEPLCCVRICSIKVPTLSRWCLPRKTTLQLALIVYRVNPRTNWNLNASCHGRMPQLFFFFSSQTMRVGYTIKHELVLASIVSIILILINTRTRGKCEAGNAFLSRCLQSVTTRNWSVTSTSHA